MKGIQDYTEYTNFPCHYARLEWIYQTIEKNRISSTPVKILDIGCGTGNITIPLGLIENAEVTGIDIHQGNIDISTAKNTFKNVTIRFESIFDCDISDFDFIILTEVLEHISFYKDVLKYIGENAKNSMQLFITVPNGFGPFEIAMQPLYLMRKIGLNGFIWRVKKLLGKKEPYSQNYDTPHVNFFTVRRLKRELLRYNMQVLQVENAYILAPIIETYLPFVPLKGFSKVDNKVAKHFPHCMASGHYYHILMKQ